jgi:hypothetical protein
MVQVIGALTSVCTDKSAVWSSACSSNPMVKLQQRNSFLTMTSAQHQSFRIPSDQAEFRSRRWRYPKSQANSVLYTAVATLAVATAPASATLWLLWFFPSQRIQGALAGRSRRVTGNYRPPGKRLSEDRYGSSMPRARNRELTSARTMLDARESEGKYGRAGSLWRILGSPSARACNIAWGSISDETCRYSFTHLHERCMENESRLQICSFWVWHELI